MDNEQLDIEEIIAQTNDLTLSELEELQSHVALLIECRETDAVNE
jgi:predicted dinucleotide-utilizing enzyme